MSCALPTMPKRGALRTCSRRSNSPGLPVSSACTGASKPSAGGGGGHVVHLAVGDHDDAGEPVGRHVGQRLGEIGEQHGAVALAVGRGRGRCTQRTSRLGKALSCSSNSLRIASVRSVRPAMAWLWLSSTHDGDHVVERLALLLLQLRIGDGEQQQRVAQQPQHRAAARAPEQQREQNGAQSGRAPTARARARRV